MVDGELSFTIFYFTSLALTCGAMKLVPPRGSGWVGDASSTTLRVPDLLCLLVVSTTNPLPRGSTDFIALAPPFANSRSDADGTY